MKKVFASGSCRLLMSLKDGCNSIQLLHGMTHLFQGPNFLGKLHNIKQHIQFIKFLKGELELPQYILNGFLTSYRKGIDLPWCPYDDIQLIPQKINNIKEQFNTCDTYIFEICSLKLCRKDNYEVHLEHTKDYTLSIQTSEDLYNDIYELIKLIPPNKHIIFQCHFRPNIIYNDNTKTLDKREVIYNTIVKFINENKYTYPNINIYDPSTITPEYFEDTDHFYEAGYTQSFVELHDLIYKD